MKHHNYIYILLSLFSILTISCQNEEKDTLPTVDGLKALPGINRAKIEFKAPEEAVNGKVICSNGQLMKFQIDKSKDVQELMVEGLQEGENIVRVLTLDENNNHSDPKGVKVTIYGASYGDGLTNRKLLSQKTISPTSIEMNFGENKSDETAVRILFTNTSGNKDSITVNSTERQVTINNIDLGKGYYYYTVYKPTSDFIDEYRTPEIDAKEAAMKNFEKEIWSVVNTSDGAPDNTANNIIDDKPETAWKAKEAKDNSWIAVDMQSQKIFQGAIFQQSQDISTGSFAKKYRFEISDDNTTWTTVQEGALKANCFKQKIDFKQSLTSRFFRITMLDKYNKSLPAQLAEIDLVNELSASGSSGLEFPVLTNAKPPFQSDGSDLFSALGANRMQKVTGWTHNSNAFISFDSAAGEMCAFSAVVWGCADVTNGKVYQTFTFLPGYYSFDVEVDYASDVNAMDMLGVVSAGTTLPDYPNVTSASEVLGYSDLVQHQHLVDAIPFVVKKREAVSLGYVYNTHNVYGTTGTPWSQMYFKGFSISAQ